METKRILVVDDEQEICDLVEIYLKNEGYQVYKFYNGTDALVCIEIGATAIPLALDGGLR